MTDTPYDPNFYAVQSGGSYRSARKIVPLVLEWTGARSVLDVGCGVGTFLRVFTEQGVTDVQGIDGDYVPRDRLLIDPARFRGHDLATPFDFGRRFDLVSSLEVAEHLPDERADGFVEALCRHGDVVLFSAAIPEQGGTHHVNERWPSYWIPKFAARGYRVLDAVRPEIWNDGEVEYWYRQNCLIFANDAGLIAAPRLAALERAGRLWAAADLVHPAMFASKAREASQLPVARAIQATLERLCNEGGAYSFSRNPDGTIAIVRR
ncbi:class I SAM-dependent methyltransferase [Azospirillum sp.]|uniref:class I SAM-dependent methyltransferase n=1 Tax=Azospirillum sp. TaxID=34012 RepID=UPI003D73DD12